MNTFTKHLLLAFAGVSLFTACNRPYATYQRTAPTRFYTTTTPLNPVTPVVVETPVATPQPSIMAEVEPVASLVAAEKPAVAIQTVQQQLTEAVASRKIDVTDKKVQKRMARVQALLTKASEKSVAGTSAPARKLSLTERMMLKKMDKQVQKHLAPEKAQALDKLSVGGIVLIIVGLIVAVILNGAVGLVLLLVGVLLLVLGLLS